MADSSSPLGVKIFADGADVAAIRKVSEDPIVQGFTTNPTLMRKAGVTDYEAFAREVLEFVTDKPISFEVFSDDLSEMAEQAGRIATWGSNVYVKIPVTTTSGQSCADMIHGLSHDGVQLNVTALMTVAQTLEVVGALGGGAPSFVSVFAGRIADSGRDPLPIMTAAVEIVHSIEDSELIWASPREVLNAVQASQIGCDVITMTNDLIAKLNTLGKDLTQFSLETVQMFRNDALSAGFTLG